MTLWEKKSVSVLQAESNADTVIIKIECKYLMKLIISDICRPILVSKQLLIFPV